MNHMPQKEEKLPPEWLRPTADFPVTGEHKIDMGLRRRSPKGFFIPGPILLSDLLPVAKMPGKTVVVWLLILYRVAYSKQEWVTLPVYALQEWGISHRAKADALQRLEQSGRIEVQRSTGGYLKVRLDKKSKKAKSP
jgi:hypothetical protein